MNIESSFASQLYASARRIAPAETPAADPAGKAAEGASFADALAAVSGEMAETLRAGEAAAQAALTGQGDVQSVVEALTATELALQTAVAVRDRVVEAYQEVLRMPI
ncbi:MAG: flagellar hook-basal body complex protein FliE [Proteobacteria bacterium]|nr:flagellar hook-basal body complex protein FliE [Pseudomonadota bacterium]